MRICNLFEISPDCITVNCRSFFHYVPTLKGLAIDGRERSAFMYVVKGGFRYRFGDSELTLAAGDILYLPEGGRYRYTVEEEGTECVQLEVEISVNGERAAFSDRPVKLCDNVVHLRGMLESLERGAGAFEKTAAVFSLLNGLLGQGGARPSISPRILPAVQYIEAHCNENIYMEDMAKLCHLSQSQMRRIFHDALDMSPIEYKNRRRMDAACNMLRYTHTCISEIADALGFENVYIFSRVFRKYMGISPSKYRAQMSGS